MKKALITGVTGQDGSYLAEFLLSQGYEVHGIIRKASTFNTSRIDHLIKDQMHIPGSRFFFHHGDLSDSSRIVRLIEEVKPDEIYHLAAQSHVRVSFDIPEQTSDIDALGTLRILEAMRSLKSPVRFYNAASSEMFGNSSPPQNENTPLCPRSPYGAAKVFGYNITRIYRDAYGIFACNGILFNHESSRRGETFVTRKITRGIARIKAGLDKKLYLGNLKAKRDWGYAPEYVEVMHKMLQQEKPGDYVISSGESYSVEEFLEEAFRYAGLDNWKEYIAIDPHYYRPTEVNFLVGDSAKAKQQLDWQPKIGFKELVKIMIDSDFRATNIEAPGEGDKILKEKFPNIWWKID